MGDRQRLRLTLRSRITRQEFPPVEIAADPENHDELQAQLAHLARDLDGRAAHGWSWAHEYELRVQSVDRSWVDFRMPGQDA